MGGFEVVCWLGVGLGFVHAAVAHGCFEAWARRAAPAEATKDGPAISFLRPLKAGVPGLREKLETMLRAMRVGDQVVFGVDVDSAEATLCEELRGAFPEREIVVVGCRAGAARNPKISKLVQMEPQARHEHWLLADAEAVLKAEFLEGFRREWQASGVGALTAGYRMRGARTWPERLDAAAALLTLWPGLGVLWAWGPLRITLGACTGLRRRDLENVGGWAAFGGELAEDNRLGAALAGAGVRIGLSRAVVTLDGDPLGWRDWWRHQRRVAVTYRAGNPLGFAGSIVTHGEFWSVLLVASGAKVAGWVTFAAFWAVRTGLAARMSRRLDFPIRSFPGVVLLATAAAHFCWWASWFTRSVWWSGRRWRVTFRGKLGSKGEKEG